MRPDDFKVFDFFSGCGGTSQGLAAAGMDIVFGLDFDKDSASTFMRNMQPTSVTEFLKKWKP